MIRKSIGSAVNYCFKDWTYVSCHEDQRSDSFVVVLTASKQLLESKVKHEHLSYANLFTMQSLEDVAKKIAAYQRSSGLRRYGKKK